MASITRQLVESHFVLIHLAEESEADEVLGALTACSEGRDYLVVFSSQAQASQFVESRTDLFEEESEVSGFWVDGRTMLDYLDDELGILLNPDGEGHRQIGTDLVREILDELGLEG
ncbi:SseB family protein [Aporhodopirellula rubra]|uniref:SseB family protein n=1 Tax=Aporhodopirellula rubra TaxID=980271 RepID=UPI0028F41CD1|nr:SseB family protein [Aporhodopirellula rubra]